MKYLLVLLVLGLTACGDKNSKKTNSVVFKKADCSVRLITHNFDSHEDVKTFSFELEKEGSEQVDLKENGKIDFEYKVEGSALLFSGRAEWKSKSGNNLGNATFHQLVYDDEKTKVPGSSSVFIEATDRSEIGDWGIAMLTCDGR